MLTEKRMIIIGHTTYAHTFHVPWRSISCANDLLTIPLDHGRLLRNQDFISYMSAQFDTKGSSANLWALGIRDTFAFPIHTLWGMSCTLLAKAAAVEARETFLIQLRVEHGPLRHHARTGDQAWQARSYCQSHIFQAASPIDHFL